MASYCGRQLHQVHIGPAGDACALANKLDLETRIKGPKDFVTDLYLLLRKAFTILVALVLISPAALAVELEVQGVAFAEGEFQVTVVAAEDDGETQLFWQSSVIEPTSQSEGRQIYTLTAPGAWGPHALEVRAETGEILAKQNVSIIPAIASLLPPVAAVIIALVFRSVLPALFLGVWTGAWLISGMTLSGIWTGFLDSFQRYSLNAIADPDHVAIIMFTMMMGGMISIIIRNGGMTGLVNILTRFANGRKSGQATISGLGFAIFFDDVANTLLVGNTMRPVADRLKISRAKLAYLVDSTAAPLASIAFATTWIGYEVALIQSAQATLTGFDQPAYSVFLNSLAYSYYPILTLLMVWLVAFSGRDFGPMLTAERLAQSGVETAAKTSEPVISHQKDPKAINAIVPIVVLILSLIVGLLVSGSGATLGERIGSADSFKVLMWASLIGVAVAGIMSMVFSSLSLGDTIEAWEEGLKATLPAMLVLVLSWAISDISQLVYTADFLVALLGDRLQPALLPAIAFLLAGTIAFTTGTSWGTMGIVLPLVVPLAWGLVGGADAASSIET